MSALALQLGKLVRLLSCDGDGERLASLAAIDRTLKASKFTWHNISEAVERHLARPAIPARPALNVVTRRAA